MYPYITNLIDNFKRGRASKAGQSVERQAEAAATKRPGRTPPPAQAAKWGGRFSPDGEQPTNIAEL